MAKNLFCDFSEVTLNIPALVQNTDNFDTIPNNLIENVVFSVGIPTIALS